MPDLVAKTPMASWDPVTIGAASVAEISPGPMASLSAFGHASALAAALEDAHGLAWPAPGQSRVAGDVRCIWFGLRDVLLMGTFPDAALSRHGAVVDQSDAWAVVSLSGSSAVDVLARLVPIDLRDSAFGVDATARTQLGHMQCSITKLRTDCFMIMVFRSMAGTLYHDLTDAMAGVAARG
ncbi:MAG: sarcosine oxidase subunit gamma family protein [Pseudomonadota bacterium]